MDDTMKTMQIVALAGPDEGSVATAVADGGESRTGHWCSVCGFETYLSFDYERESGRRFCTNHWAPLRCRTKPAVCHNPR